MNKLSLKISAALALVVIGGFSAATILSNKNISYEGKENLDTFPEFSFASMADGSFFKDLGDYFTDRFAGRSGWLSSKAKIDYEIGESNVNGVYITYNRMLDTEKVSYPDADEADCINRFTQNYEGTVCFAAIPSSYGVYSDLLPDYMDKTTEKNAIDSLYESLDSGIKKIDAFNILKMLNDNYIYYRSDSKWTGYGAYCVYRTVIQKLGFQPTVFDRFTIEHISGDFRGNFFAKTRYDDVKADMLDVYTYPDGAEITGCISVSENGTENEATLYDKSYIESSDMYSFYMGESQPLIRITTSLNNDRKLLVIKNDYADCFIPFLLQHYSEIAVVYPECFEKGISSIIDVNDYPQTLFLFGIDEFPDAEKLNVINK